MLRYLFLCPVLLFATLTKAQWNPNTSVNLEVATLPMMDMQSLTTSTGRTWVAYYHNNSGNYDMRAQLLDVDGTKLLGPDGMLVDNQPSGSATFVFNICKDANDNLIVAYQDQRSGGLNAVVYKVSQAGAHLWSSTGVVLGGGLAPYPAVLSNGETVVAWNESTSNTLKIQKVSTAGTTAWPTPVTVQVGTSNTTRGQLVAGTNGNFTMVFQKRGTGIATTLYAQRYNSSGTALWTAPVQLSTETTSGARYYSVANDGDVTYCGYYSSLGSRFNSWLQRINADGSLPYGMNGSAFSTATSSADPYQQSTNIALNPGSLYIWSLCSYSNTNQNQYGVYVQKFLKSTGARLFSDNAQVVYPISSSFDTQAGEVSLVNDAPVFLTYDVNYKIYATRLDANGAFVWSGNRIELSSTTATMSTPKGRFGFSALANGQSVAVWAETRNGVQKAYAQNISPGGLFLLDVTTQGNIPASINISSGTLQMVSTIYPTTASQAVTWSIIPGTGTAAISASGLVTAISNGTVWAKAISVQDNTVSDSLQIMISGQVPAGPPGFNFNSPTPVVTNCPAPSSLSVTLNTTAVGGFSGTISLTASGVPVGTTASFSVNPVAVGNSVVFSLAGTNQLSPGTYTITIEGSASGVSTQTANLSFTINAPSPITITQQPVSQVLCAGSVVSYSVAATGGVNLSYQWQLSTNGCNGPWSNIAGATSATYSIASISSAMDNSAYRCIINGSCAAPLTSGCGLLTVISPVIILVQPTSQTICEGSSLSFTTSGSGSGVIYQWQVNTGAGFVNITNGTNYSGANLATLTITSAPISFNNYQYRCLLSNATCSSATATSNVTLTMNALPTITSQPQSQIICQGTNAQFSVTASGSSLQYQWQVNNGNGFTNVINGTNYAGANTATLVISGSTVAMNGYQYRCIVTGVCSPIVTSATVSLTVQAPALITSSPVNTEVCAGTNVSFNVNATSSTTINYQWQISTDGGTNWSAIPGANGATLSLPAVAASQNGNRYRCQVSTATCSVPSVSLIALLSVRNVPSIALNASPVTSILPGQTTTLTAAPSGTSSGVVLITWTYAGQPMSPQPGNTWLVDVTRLGTYQASIRETWPSGLFCSSASSVVTITTSPSEKLFIFPSPNDGRFSVSYYNNAGNVTKRHLTVFDGKGARVYMREFPISGPYTILPVDLKNIARGVYYLVVGDANGNKLAEGKVHIR